MAQTFTLEQAAERLGLSVEEFKRRLREDWKSVRSFRDGPTLRFRAADIDELARSLGEASDPGVPLGVGAVPLTDSSEEIPIAPPPKPKAAPEPLLALADDTAESADDIFTVPTGDSGVGKKKKGDSDVRLDMTPTALSDDSEITEELSLDLPADGGSGVLKSGSPSSVKLTGPSSGKNGPASGKLGGPRSGKLTAPDSARIPGPGSVPAGDDGSSEFELSLDASDSDSFELTLASDSSEEVDLGTMPDDDGRGKSGIKLDQPADSGVSLERRAADPADESDIEFELSLDPVAPASGRLTGPKTDKKKKPDDSDSEFELSLDDNSGVTDGLVDDLNLEADKGDIFETDFELPVVAEDESGSEVIAVESADTDLENSDFDIAIEDSDAPMDDESASQVVLVDDDAPVEVGEVSEDDAMVLSDDDVQPVSPSRKRRSLLDDDDVLVGEVETDDGPSASKALRGVKQGDDDTPIRSAPVGPPKWGALPALFLLPCLVVVVLGGLMMFEMIRGQWGYTQPSKPSDALVRGVAKTLDMKVSE